MIDMTLHPTPRWRGVVLAQIRIVGLVLKPAALVVAAVLSIGTVVIVGEIIGGGPGFDSSETFPTLLIGFLYPFAVWRNEKPFGPGLFWTFPVERRGLALAKVFAGFVWLMGALAVFVMWLLALGFLADAPPARTITRVPVTATAAMYLFGSALVLGLRHPLRWLLGAGGVLFLMNMLGNVVNRPENREWQYVPGSDAFLSVTRRAFAAWVTLPEPTQWAISTLLMFGGGFAALWAAASRHRDRRRHRNRHG
ncbi:MAG TPA: hypothetical protein VEK11_07985 [Thermoanaerobaculia bacterium]|nr:hypothetical protein [Thermoanaerobaculia bacterium]